MIFNQSDDGLYYHDMVEGGFGDIVLSQVITGVPTETTLIETVAENQEGFTKRQLVGA